MEGRAVIAWTPENWLTVVLMVWVGGAIIATAAHLIYRAKGDGNAA